MPKSINELQRLEPCKKCDKCGLEWNCRKVRDCPHPAVNGEYILTTEFYNSLAEAYPHTDIDECIKSIKIWLTVNPAKRKPSNSMDRFVSNWIKGRCRKGANTLGMNPMRCMTLKHTKIQLYLIMR